MSNDQFQYPMINVGEQWRANCFVGLVAGFWWMDAETAAAGLRRRTSLHWGMGGFLHSGFSGAAVAVVIGVAGWEEDWRFFV